MYYINYNYNNYNIKTMQNIQMNTRVALLLKYHVSF